MGVLAIGLVSGPMSQSTLTLADDRIIVSGKNHSKECNKIKKKFHRKVKKNVFTSFGFFFICSEPKKKSTYSKSTVCLSPRMAVPN